jgi:putative transposase
MPKNQWFYHFTGSTKYRKSLLNPEIRKILFKSIIAKAVELGSIVLALNGVEDHVHMLVSASPSIAPSVLIGQVKGASSHLVRHMGWSEFEWQAEYGVKTVSERDAPIVMRYIQNQEKDHESNA